MLQILQGRPTSSIDRQLKISTSVTAYTLTLYATSTVWLFNIRGCACSLGLQQIMYDSEL